MVEPEQRQPNAAQDGVGHLLILACSKTKNDRRIPAPALSLYDGGSFQVLRKFFREYGWPPGLDVRILSAKYGLIEATEVIELYDQRMSVQAAVALRNDVLSELRKRPRPESAFINLGKDYLPAVQGIESQFPGSEVIHATGRIGERMHQMKEWLARLQAD